MMFVLILSNLHEYTDSFACLSRSVLFFFAKKSSLESIDKYIYMCVIVKIK